MGIRPEHVELLLELADQALEGSVELAELTGAETSVTVALGAERLIARAGAEVAVRPGDQVWVRPQPGRILRFDASGVAQKT